MAARRKVDETSTTRRRPATTPEAQENQLISSAFVLAGKQIDEGTASSQVITHFLKLGSSREKLEQERIAHENELLKVKKEAMESQQRTEELFAEAIRAMRSYTGEEPPEDDEYEE